MKSSTAARLEELKRLLAKHPTIKAAAEATGVTSDTIKSAFLRQGLNASSFLRGMDSPAPAPLPTMPPKGGEAQITRLVQLVKKRAESFSDLCDRLDVSPKKLRELLERAAEQGYDLSVDGQHVGIVPPMNDRIVDTGIEPVEGGWNKIGHLSDTHAGSHYAMRAQLRDFVERCYALGIRHITHSGDCLDGDYRHGKFEMRHMGLEAQIQDMLETFPELPGLNYHFITGNHDHTFTAASGVNVGRAIVSASRERGHGSKFHYYGARNAYLNMYGATINLWHPGGGQAYAKSYKLQKKIEAYNPGRKPHILFAGHWHFYTHLYERGVHAFASPSMQGGGSDFANSLVGNGAIGGLIVKWRATKHGTIRDLNCTARMYFEREVTQHVETAAE